MIDKAEHPKPQFQRKNWRNLNGKWQFEFDHGNSGVSRGLQEETAIYGASINVPFCPESKLSGIEYKDFMSSVWYKRSFTVSQEELAGIVRVHFGAVDYKATVYINGQYCGEHKGGYVSFFVDATALLRAGENVLTVHAEDDTRSGMIPTGKQSRKYESYGCAYTRTTGIWQTVWLEFLPKTHVEKVKYYPDIDASAVTVVATLCGAGTLFAEASFAGEVVGCASVQTGGGVVVFQIPLSKRYLWEIGKGNLYDLKLTYGEDEVQSYFGLRKIRMDGYKFLLNEKSVFQRLVLDQGFYPDGIYTAPSDEELEKDVLRSLAMGFNGARLHEKVFEERFLYHCDRHGYIVWGEYPNWGLDHTRPESAFAILPEWTEEVERDFNHPSIVGWCPFNETWDIDGRKQCDEVLALVYDTTKALDPTRPCIDTSGNYHVKTDIYDIHDYGQNPKDFAARFEKIPEDGAVSDGRSKYKKGQPFFVSEYGGIGWSGVALTQNGWGQSAAWSYGKAPETPEEFLARLEGLTDVLLSHPYCMGYCYTQLTDVEQEQNGLYTYDRKAKFPPEVVSKILNKKAKIED